MYPSRGTSMFTGNVGWLSSWKNRSSGSDLHFIMKDGFKYSQQKTGALFPIPSQTQPGTKIGFLLNELLCSPYMGTNRILYPRLNTSEKCFSKMEVIVRKNKFHHWFKKNHTEEQLSIQHEGTSETQSVKILEWLKSDAEFKSKNYFPLPIFKTDTTV